MIRLVRTTEKNKTPTLYNKDLDLGPYEFSRMWFHQDLLRPRQSSLSRSQRGGPVPPMERTDGVPCRLVHTVFYDLTVLPWRVWMLWGSLETGVG